jgi:hypothetical protein
MMDILTAKNTSCYIVGALDRPGTLLFATELENKYYAPDTELNDQYNIFYTKYGDAPHYIIEIPKSDISFVMDEFIKQYDLVLRNGLPFGNKGKFPLLCNDSQAWTLESSSNEQLNPEEIYLLLLDEHRKVKELEPALP